VVLGVTILAVFHVNLVFDLGLVPATLIGAAIGGGAGVIAHLLWRR